MDPIIKALNSVKSQLSRKYVAILPFDADRAESDMGFFDPSFEDEITEVLKGDGYKVERHTDRYDRVELYVMSDKVYNEI